MPGAVNRRNALRLLRPTRGPHPALSSWRLPPPTRFAMPAPALPRAEPESVGLSSARLRRIGEALRRDIEAGQLPGAVVGIMRGGKLAHLEAVGMRDPATREPLETDCDLLDRLHDQGDDLGGRHGAGRGGTRAAGRPGVEIFAPALRAEGGGARRWDAGAEAIADHPGPAAPHLGPHLPRPRHHPGACPLSRILRVGGGENVEGGGHRRAGQVAAAVRSRLELGIRLLHGRVGLRRRGRERASRSAASSRSACGAHSA